MGNGLVLYQGALLHEQFVALVTLEPLEDICFMSELLYWSSRENLRLRKCGTSGQSPWAKPFHICRTQTSVNFCIYVCVCTELYLSSRVINTVISINVIVKWFFFIFRRCWFHLSNPTSCALTMWAVLMWWTRTLSSTFAGNSFLHWSHLIVRAAAGLNRNIFQNFFFDRSRHGANFGTKGPDWDLPVYPRPCWTPPCSPWPAPPPPPSSPTSNSHWTRTDIHCHCIESLNLILLCTWGFGCFSNLCHECQSQLLFLVLPKIYSTTKVFHLKDTEMNCLVKSSTKLHTFASTSSVSLKISPVNPGGTAVRSAGSWMEEFLFCSTFWREPGEWKANHLLWYVWEWTQVLLSGRSSRSLGGWQHHIELCQRRWNDWWKQISCRRYGNIKGKNVTGCLCKSASKSRLCKLEAGEPTAFE